MKEIKNKTPRPIRIPLPGGKTLHLGPSQTAQVADNAVEHAAFEKLVADGAIEILGAGERATSSTGAAPARGQSKGSAKSFRRGQGDR